MEFPRLILDMQDSVATIRFNHREVLNALSDELINSLDQAVSVIEDPANDIRCLVLTGVGRAFCAGANLQNRRADDNAARPPAAGVALETLYHPLLRRLRSLPCPIVTAVNGLAAGAGMSVALLGDVIRCARSADVLQAFRRIGLVQDCGSTWLLPRRIGTARALELSLLGEKLPAQFRGR